MRFPSRPVASRSRTGPGPRGLRRRLIALAGAIALLGGLLPAAAVAPALAGHTAAPTAVTVAGSLQQELGCPGDWQPDCAATHLAYDSNDTVWQAVFNVPAGEWEYKAPVNDAWPENYGRFAQHDGPNIPLSVGDANPTKFYYDHKSHWITSSRNAAIATVAGSFQSELGCPGDWQPECLRSWLQDPDEDGVYRFVTDDVPAGDYEFKVARDEAWNTSYPADNVPFGVDGLGDTVTFTYTLATNAVTVEVEPTAPPDPDDAVIARHSLRDDLTDEVFYFVLPDRFDNGDPTNDEGGLSGDKLVTGLDPADKGFYHGGDIAGLLDRLDYIEDLGTTAVWMAPLFKNRPVQGEGANASAGYHGYWITDFTQLDPHFGTNAELAAFVDAAHARGIKVFFDIITNHTADVIDYEEGQYSYRDKGSYPYVDANGVEFDDRDYAGTGTFPPLDPATSFPYTPVFPTPADATVKVPSWLNDPTLYHNRGDSTFAGESSNYGDFIGLDDLFTEHPDVQDGMIEIYETWVTEVGIDGFRIDTAKHVNMEFWQAFSPALQGHAATLGDDDFFMFGEVFDSNPSFMSQYTTEGTLQATLDFGFQSRAQAFAATSAATNDLRDFFAQDDWYTDADSNAYSLPTFLGNHDMGRIGRFVSVANPGAGDAELLARDRLAHSLMYLVRGQPVVYYGDEQGFTGDGGDKDARQDMMPSVVGTYNDDDLIGTDATTADANFDPAHPVYAHLAGLAALKAAHPALQDGAQIHRFSTGSAGIFAFSRIDVAEGREYVVALNNSETEQTQLIQTYSAAAGFTLIWPTAGATATTNGSGQLSVTVPPLSAVVYRADATLAADTAAPAITIVDPAEGSDVLGRVEIGATLDSPEFAEVTFAVKAGDAADWTIIGTDDNAPYRVFHDVTGLAAGTPLLFKAVVRDRDGNLDSDTGTAVVGEAEPPGGGGGTPDYAVVHYLRPGADYDGWGFHFWGDIDQTVEWGSPVPLAGEDEYGPFAWVKLLPNASSVGFIAHQGDTKDPLNSPDRFFNPTENPEIWLKQGDLEVYTSQAWAQGYVDIHYQRPDGVYTGWGLHLWGDAIADGVATEWTSPRTPDGTDDYGVYWRVPLKPGEAAASLPVNFIIHKGDEKDPGPDQSLIPTDEPAVWIQSGDTEIHGTRGSAEDMAVIHYHRPDGDYGDPTSPNFNDFWGVHSWAGHLDPDPTWDNPIRPTGFDRFGAVFELDLDDGATQLAYIIHRGDAKDANPDQTLDLVEVGHEVWYLSGHVDADSFHKYLLPVEAGVGVDANLARQKAHWLTADTIAWNIEPIPGGDYAVWSAPEGGLAVEGGAITGGVSIPLSRVPGGLSDELKAKWPHLASYQAFRILSADLEAAKAALTGQLAVSASDDTGALRIATGVQIPGVLDDLYAYSGDLGVTWAGGAPTIRVWAPTAKSVTLQRYPDATAAGAIEGTMALDETTGVWSISGDASWKNQFYLYEVEVYAPTTDAVETNLVTDPYSFALATNSTRTQIVDLADAALAPSGWASTPKPALAQPEDIALYELHVRDFSINDATVPAAERGTYLAFTEAASDGMAHLRALADAGLSHVHLLPAFDIATIEEDRGAQLEPPCDLESYGPASEEQQACIGLVRNQDGFNWGYDPWHYTTPEGSYATDPSGAVRTVQFRSMVQSLNQTGLRVVMDVVYNHTNAAGQAEKSVLDRIVPGYYHRLLDDGTVANSTCCANTATEHAMMEKLMIDSLVTWAREYKVDGFRFDLMGHHTKANMLAVREALDGLTLADDGVDGSSIYLYGEGWNFGEVANDARFVQATQLNMDGTGIGTFNDRLRDAARGGGPFDGNQTLNQGFGSGLYTDPNEFQTLSPADQKARLLLLQDQIKVGLTGNLQDFEFVDRTGAVVKGSQVDYNGSPVGYTSDPQEAITYVEAHDNETLFDVLAYKLPQTTSAADRARAQIVALSTVAFGQGVPFFHAGAELLRSKSLDRNSYDSGDWFNRIFFDGSSNNFGVGLPREDDNGGAWPVIGPILSNPVIDPAPGDIAWTTARFEELLEIRASSRLFRLGTADAIMARVTFPDGGPNQVPGLIVMRISDVVGADLDAGAKSMIVVFNAADTAQSVSLADAVGGHFQLHKVQRTSEDETVTLSKFKQKTGTFTVPARTTAVFVELQPGRPGGSP